MSDYHYAWQIVLRYLEHNITICMHRCVHTCGMYVGELKHRGQSGRHLWRTSALTEHSINTLQLQITSIILCSTTDTCTYNIIYIPYILPGSTLLCISVESCWCELFWDWYQQNTCTCRVWMEQRYEWGKGSVRVCARGALVLFGCGQHGRECNVLRSPGKI